MKHFMILLLACLLLVGAGCSKDAVKEENKPEETENNSGEEVKDKDQAQPQQKEEEHPGRVETALLKEKTETFYDLKDGNSAYQVHLYKADGETFKNDFPDFTGEVPAEETLMLFLTKENSEYAFLQTELVDSFAGFEELDPKGLEVKVSELEDKTMLSFFKPESTNWIHHVSVIVKDDNLTTLDFGEGGNYVFGSSIKAVPGNHIQLIQYENNFDLEESGYIFKTWELDSTSGTLTHVDKVVYNDVEPMTLQLGKYNYDMWWEKETNYHPFKNLTWTKDVLVEAAKGRLPGASFSIGEDISVLSALGEPMESGWHMGGIYLYYPEATYSYAQGVEKIVKIDISQYRLGLSYPELLEVLGEPSYEGESEMDGSTYATYEVGEYSLFINTFDGEHIYGIFLK